MTTKLKQLYDDSQDVVDTTDYKNVLVGIMRQAIDDYIKLVHPNIRRKTYLQELYLTAVEFIFDDEYRLAVLQNGFNEDISVPELLAEIMDAEEMDMTEFRAYVVREANKYWEEKQMSVLDNIPDTVFISGHTFTMVQDEDVKTFLVNHDEKTISLNKKATLKNQQNFLHALIYTSALLRDLNITTSVVSTLSKDLFQMLKTNNAFSFNGIQNSEA